MAGPLKEIVEQVFPFCDVDSFFGFFRNTEDPYEWIV